MSKNQILILDTNVILNNPQIIYNFETADLVLPLIVIEELDKIKIHFDNSGINARVFIKLIDGLMAQGNLFTGIKIKEGLGTLRVIDINLGDFSFKSSSTLDLSLADNKILATAIVEQFNNPNRQVKLITNDLNLRIKSSSLGVVAEGYNKDKTVTNRNELYSGFCEKIVDDELIDRFYSGEKIIIDGEGLYCNQFINLIGTNNPKKSGLARFISDTEPLKKVNEYKKGIQGIMMKNREQILAMNLLMDPTINLVALTGLSGSGKTLLTLAAALQQVLGTKQIYRKLIVLKPIVPVGTGEVGFLKGSLDEKLSPWMGNVSDNLEYLFDSPLAMQEYIDQGIIELSAIVHVRGRSVSDTLVIVDESMNLTLHEAKALITRIGENSKIVLLGDIDQIDNKNLSDVNNGLTYVIEKFKGLDLFGSVKFIKGERSRLATIGSQIL